jgi:hypothetical protein
MEVSMCITDVKELKRKSVIGYKCVYKQFGGKYRSEYSSVLVEGKAPDYKSRSFLLYFLPDLVHRNRWCCFKELIDARVWRSPCQSIIKVKLTGKIAEGRQIGVCYLGENVAVLEEVE